VVVTSSSVVCGSSSGAEVRHEHDTLGEHETTPPYVTAKAAQETAAFAEGEATGVAVVAANPTVVVGPHDVRLSPSNAIITTFLLDPLRLTYPGGCNIVAAADVARGHLLLLERGRAGERYILGAENLTWPDVHRAIADLCGVAGPYFETGHSGAYLAAAADELIGRVLHRPPLTTRAQARMVGRYYWYSHERAGALGYAPRPSRTALAEAIAWLAASPHVSRELRTTLRLSREVYRARFGEASA
jgi:dihydroflavonol-4-reductase